MEQNQIKSKPSHRILKAVGIGVIILALLVLIAFVGLKKNIDTRTMNKSEFEHFTVYDQQLQDKTITEINAALDGIYVQYADLYRLNPAQKIDIVVYSDQADFKRAYLGYILSWVYRDVDWMVGGAYQDMIIIVSPEAPGSTHNYEYTLEILQHELIHVFNFQLNSMPEMFLDEGLAVFLSGQGEQERKPDFPVPTFKEMNSWNAAEFGENGGYYYAYQFSAFLVEKYGLETVLEIVRTGEYEAVIGKSFEEMYIAWGRTMQQ